MLWWLEKEKIVYVFNSSEENHIDTHIIILELAAATSQVFWQGTHCKSDKLLRAKGTRGL